MYECEHEERRKNPKERASIFSLITFFYARDIFRISSRRDLNEDDVYNVLESCESARLGDLVESAWNAECARNPKDPSLFRTLARAFGWEHWTLAVNLIFHRSLFMAFQPYLVERLVTYFKPEQTDVTQTQAYFYGSILTILFVFKHTYAHNCEFLMSQLAIKARAGLSSLIYRKSLSLSQSSVMELSSGRIITLINKDIYTLDETIICANEICMGTIELCVMSYIMYVAIGTPALIAVGIIFISLPIQVLLAKYTTKLREECGAITDERLRLIQEILSTIRVIKMYTWERFYATRTCKERKAEMKKLRLITYVRGLVMILGKFSIKISFYACVMIYLYYGGIMRTEKIFVVLTCYSSIKSVLGVEIPLAFAFLSETRAAMHRITRLLYEPSLHVDGEEAKNASKGANAVPMVKLDDVIVTLNAKKIFDGVSLEFREGLIALTGPLGAGKSCLLKTILRDLRIVSGNVVVNGKVSYASQEPWIFPGTIKQNILFGQPYEPERYQRVLDVCALRSDVDCLPEGDDTVLIDKGLNLSRGQQTRVNLARAIYRDADIYLLDDTLSALDTNVSSYIFANCFKDFLKNKLCVIVMEQMLYLQDIDKILYIKDGKVTAEGSYEEIMRGKYGEELLKNRIDFEQEIDKIVADETNFPEAMENLEASDRGGLMLLNKKNVYYEEKKLGKIDWETFEVYLKSGRPLYVLFVAIGAFLVATTCGTYFDYFVTKWTDAEETIYNLTLLNMTNSSEYETAMAQKLQVPKLYTTLIAVIVAMHVVETALYFHYTMSISINLHNDIFGKMIRATMKFFDLHLTGNILNRFAKDMTQIDERLPNTFYEGLGMIFWTGGIFVLIASAHYVFILYTIILILILFMMRTRYMPAGRSLNRLDASTRAPVIGHINATLEGLTIIRASEVQKVLMKQFDKHQDLHSSATHMNLTASRAFGFYLDVFCIGYISAIIFTFLSAPSESSASSVGLAVTQSLSLSWLVQRVIRNTAAMEQSLTSVERVIEYSKAELEDDKIGRTVANWPTRGRIEFRRVALRYASNPEPMLADLSFTIEPKQKIGVIGRTGAGKSSIISILFRLYEIDGQILIDGQDIGELNLKFLRASLSIIPQSPVLFTGTLRSNLDPNGEYADESLWKALEAVDIRGIVNDLDAKIEEGGSNFSIGQKQLLCLARALLRKNKILILDEATANVDTNTDVLIQKTIADHFTEFTVITIAHRLNTVMGHDKILVMDRGRVIEFDTTKNLLRNHGSRFYCMAKNAGLVS